MPRRPISYCDVNDCDLRVAGRGLCRKHYWRMRLTGTTDDPTPPRNQSPCAVDDCGRPARSRGWCATHVRAILTDLIAELVGDDGDGHELTGAVEDGCQVCAAIDRAEARLREVSGE